MATAKMLHHFQFQTEISYHTVDFFLAYLFYHVVFNVVAIVVGVVADVVVVGVQIGKASATTILWMFCWGL